MINVFFSDISSFNLELQTIKILDKNRSDYVESISDKKRKTQSVLVWKLLEHTLKTNGFSDLKFCQENGKWSVLDNKIYFSLAHSENVIVVAISDSPVGVDVEKVTDKCVKVGKKLFNEVAPNDVLEKDFYTELWTKKESRFKKGDEGEFSTFKINCFNTEYCVCVCANTSVKCLKNVDFVKYI